MPSLRAILPPTITTPRLTLVLYDPENQSHLDRFVAMVMRPSITGFAGGGPQSLAELHAYNERTRLRPSAFSGHAEPVVIDSDLQWLVFRAGETADDAPLLGGAGVRQRSARLAPDLGFGLKDEFWGHGYATEAARAVLTAVTAPEVGVLEVEARAMPQNAQSLRVCRKLGFVEAGKGRLADGREHFRFVLPGMDTSDNDIPVTSGGVED